MRTQRQSTDAQVVNAGRDAVALARSYHCDDIAGADTMLDQMDWREVDVTLVAAACMLARAARLLSQEMAWRPDAVFERLLDGLEPSGPAAGTTFPHRRPTRHMAADLRRWGAVGVFLMAVAVLVVIPHVLVGAPWPWQWGSMWHNVTHRPYYRPDFRSDVPPDATCCP
ncbi:MAG: hypothetical protein M3083_08730 [Actinomycetota bacterium]|nr:hypothetical protein [Actinomycetota bacterium]